MTYYLVFDWGNNDPVPVATMPPVNHFIGCTTELPEIRSAGRDENGVQHFGLAYLNQEVEFDTCLFRGKSQWAKVYVNYDHLNGLKNGRAVMVFVEVDRG